MFMCTLAIVCSGPAWADPSNLSGGVFIAHHVPQLVYSGLPEDACGDYAAYAITSAEEQLNRIDTLELSTWFVLSAWCEEKEFRTYQFGLGDYDDSAYVIYRYGPCGAGQMLEICTAQWPGPMVGTAVVATDFIWSGNYVPIYHFSGYAYYGETVIPLDRDHSVSIPYGGWVNCDQPLGRTYPAMGYGGMGIHTGGIYMSPMVPSAAARSSWGAIKTIYR
jgi:hypothetical protein